MLRIIGGKFRGSKLEQPPMEITRPTKDRVKEAFFSMIQFKIPDAIVLDLFSGSGALSLESVSRGALKAIAVDKSFEAVKVIKNNVEKLKARNVEVIQSDVLNAIKRLEGSKFDFIFLDPPFADYKIYLETLKLIKETKILKDLGLVILETNNVNKIKIPHDFVIQKEKSYGYSKLLVLANNI